MKNNKRVIGVIVIVLILAVGGYFFLKKKSSPLMSPELKKAQQEMLSQCKFDPDFCKYAANGIVAMSGGYTLTSESTFNGKVSKTIIKTDGKENSESITYSDGKEEGSFISLNKTTYMKAPGDKEWTEFPPTKDETGKPTTNLFDFEGLKKELGNAAKDEANSLVVKKVGTEACGSLTCSVFEMSEKITNSTTKIWVDTKDYFARKMETQSKEGVSTMMFTYGSVSIKKPSPVKVMPALNTTGNTGISSQEVQQLMKQVPSTAEETPAE